MPAQLPLAPSAHTIRQIVARAINLVQIGWPPADAWHEATRRGELRGYSPSEQGRALDNFELGEQVSR
jgi:hypothetical protein